ncbi:MAG: AraC family transcriptional regulator [Myxococcales bacterium]|nr:AraC family transcriptional regulator [Myxococcales bacterium]
MELTRETLGKSIAQWTKDKSFYETKIGGLLLFRHETPTEPTIGLYEPSICLVAQGSKQAHLGNGDAYVYDACSYLLTSIHMPAVYQVITASPEKPFLGLTFKLDQNELSDLMLNTSLPPPRSQSSESAMGTGQVTLPLLSAFQRLLDLLDEQENIPILAPLIQREILHRLLVGDQGERLRQTALAWSHSYQIARAIEWLKEHYTQPLRVDDLAAQVHMSKSTFHHHFKSMTALSPLQFQKQLRLQEARRLMLLEHLDVGAVAYEVGYESPSQFSREYKRMFGAPPMKDLARIRQVEDA